MKQCQSQTQLQQRQIKLLSKRTQFIYVKMISHSMTNSRRDVKTALWTVFVTNHNGLTVFSRCSIFNEIETRFCQVSRAFHRLRVSLFTIVWFCLLKNVKAFEAIIFSVALKGTQACTVTPPLGWVICQWTVCTLINNLILILLFKKCDPNKYLRKKTVYVLAASHKDRVLKLTESFRYIENSLIRRRSVCLTAGR